MKVLSLAIALMACFVYGCSSPGNGGTGKTGSGQATRPESAAGLSYNVPTSWTTSPPSSGMRVAQYNLPGGAEGGGAPEVVLYFFGEGKGGETQANIDRWIGQMEQPDGQPSADRAQRATRKVHELKVTTIRLNGTYKSSMMPGMAHGDSQPGYRMWGAVVEGKGGPWFFKAVGPQKAMEEADPSFNDLVASLATSK